ncbi:NAD(P)-binding protein [Backusella circina FSU 941]|nr:NAD(P)-binding protein [Backusella circina FSU 941]
MSNLLVLSQSDVNELLGKGNCEAAIEIVDLMADAFAAFTDGHLNPEEKAKLAQSPVRIGVSTDSHRVLFMPSRMNNTTSIKIVSVPTKDGLSGLPASVLVINEETASVEAIMNGADLTAVRTAAGSGVATSYYADPNAKNLVVFGAGAQGRSHVDMMVAVRPSLERVAIWNRGEPRRTKLIEELKIAYPKVKFVSANENLETEVRNADIICTCTNSTEPVLFGAWLKQGVHLNCVGSYRMDMHEVDAETIKRVQVITVDSVTACEAEAGELVKSSKPEDWTEIGEIILSERNTVLDIEKITLFKSVGISLQDSAIAGLMVKKVKNTKLGSVVPF